MKKIVLVLLCLLMASAAFSMDMAAGGGLAAETITMTAGDYKETDSGFGAYGFFGLSRYLELSINVLGVKSYGESGTMFDIGAYGKYPIPLSDKFVFFPLAGADYAMLNSDYGSVSFFWVRAGVGLDFFLTDSMFLRGQFLYGLAVGGDVEKSGAKVGDITGSLIRFGLGWMF